MKYKIIVVFLIIFSLFLGIFADNYIKTINPTRQEQHTIEKENTCTDEDEFCTNLPIVKITLDDELSTTKNIVNGNFTLIDNDGTSNRLEDESIIDNKIQIRYRGNSSLYFDKHQYLVKFIDSKGNNKDISILNMNKENRWILNGPYLDKTLMRNYVIYNISGKFMKDTPEVRYCELYVNDEYQGVYLIIEAISQELTGITKYKKEWSNGMTSYILKLDRVKWDSKDETIINNFTNYIGKTDNRGISIVYPTEENLSDAIKNYITDDFSKIEKMLYSYNYDEYSDYINVDSFVDYFIVNEFFMNKDAGTYSTYLYKDVRGKLNIGPIWDFNNSLDNYVEQQMYPDNFYLYDKLWFEMLLKDERFVNKVIKRYKYLRKNYLSDKYIQNYIDSTQEYLGNSVARNYSVWGYTFTQEPINGMLYPYSRNYTSYDEAVIQMKTFIYKRGLWMDENIENLKVYCHSSINKSYVGN